MSWTQKPLTLDAGSYLVGGSVFFLIMVTATNEIRVSTAKTVPNIEAIPPDAPCELWYKLYPLVKIVNTANTLTAMRAMATRSPLVVEYVQGGIIDL